MGHAWTSGWAAPTPARSRRTTGPLPGRAAITAVLEWARTSEFRSEGSPVETVRRQLPKRAGGPKHHGALHFSGVGNALARIDAGQCVPSTRRAMRVAWGQFDLEAAVWTKPAEATKAAKPHRVPLSRQALDVLAEARKATRGALVFPGSRPGAMMGNSVMPNALRTAGVAASGHGFRSSFKDWARHHDVDELLSEFALAHVEGSATVAAYARDDLLEKRLPVMQRWADCIASWGSVCRLAGSDAGPGKHGAHGRCVPAEDVVKREVTRLTRDMSVDVPTPPAAVAPDQRGGLCPTTATRHGPAPRRDTGFSRLRA